MPQKAKDKLSEYGDILEFESREIVYPAISGHPDIFFCQTPNHLFTAPNTPREFLRLLDKRNITYLFGSSKLLSSYPNTVFYNAVVTNTLLIHSLKYTDYQIINLNNSLNYINVRQAYTRCNVVCLSDKYFIVSDKGIEKKLVMNGLKTFYIDPNGVLLPGMKHGFFGGCCGTNKKKLFITGSLKNIPNQNQFIDFVTQIDFEPVELYNGPLFDSGGIFFVGN